MNRHKRFLWSSNDKEQTTEFVNITTQQPTLNTTSAASNTSIIPDESGVIAGVVFGILLSLGLVTVAIYLYRQKRHRDVEYQRARNVQSRSMMNAGVYMDTTTDSLVNNPRSVNKENASTSLHVHKDLYEDDSDDEI